MKKYALLILLLFVLAFSGCAKPEPETTPPATTTTAPVIACKRHALSELSGCCRICGMPYFEVALEFELNETKDGYVVMGPGISKRTDIVIPATYMGLPVTEIGEKAFYYDPYDEDTAFCATITSVVIPGSVTKIGELAFAVCESLKTVELSQGLREIGVSAFAACGALTEIVVPEGVTTIDVCAFYNCPNLTRLELPDSVTTMGNAVIGMCPKLTSIRIPNGITEIPDEFAADCAALKTVEMGSNVERIGAKAFNGCVALEAIDCGTKLTIIDSGAFSGCANLATVKLPGAVKEIGESAFNNCALLSTINIPDTIEYIAASAFDGCAALQCVVYEGMRYFGTTANPYLILMCKDDESVMNVVVHKDTKSVQRALLATTGIESITVGDNVTDFPVVEMCKLEVFPEVVLSPNNKHFRVINNCLIRTRTKTLVRAYEGFVIPDDGTVTIIGEQAFAGMRTVETIIIPDCIVELGAGAFAQCDALKTLVIGSGVEKIGDNVLSKENSLSAVYFRGTKNQWKDMKGLEVANFFGMEIALYNPVLKALPCYFYSETKKSGGEYWHYVDGIPTLWKSEE